MTQENTNEIEVTIKKKVTLRGSGMDVLDILDLTKTNNNSVRLTLLVGNDDSKIEPEATTFGIKVDQLKFINDLVSDELNLRPDQLQAIHAKKAEKVEKKVVEAKKEEPIRTIKPRAISLPDKQEKVTVLPSQAAKPVDWKDRSDIKRNRPRIDDSMVTSIINTALAYNPGKRRMCTFSRYLEETIPEQFRIAKDQAMRIYLCQSYAHIGVARKSDWTAKLNELCRAHKGFSRQIPEKIRKMYLRGGN